MREVELCKVDGDNGNPLFSPKYARWTCTYWRNHRGPHSWERKGRYEVR